MEPYILRVLLIISISFFALVVSGATYFYVITEPLKMNSFDSWFRNQFDINARYWVTDNKLEILVFKGQLKVSDKFEGSNSRVDEITFGLSREFGARWYTFEKSDVFNIHANLKPKSIQDFYFKRFSVPILETMVLENHWITIEGKSDVNGTPTTWYAHSLKDIFKK